MGWGGECELACKGKEWTSELGNPLIGSLAHGIQDLSVGGITRQIFKFVRIILEVMEELMVAVVNVANVFVAGVADAFEGWDAASNGKMFVKRFGAPFGRCVAADDRVKAVSLIALGDVDAGPIEEGGGQVQIQGDGVGDLASFGFLDSWIHDDEWDPK